MSLFIVRYILDYSSAIGIYLLKNQYPHFMSISIDDLDYDKPQPFCTVR